MPEIEALSHNLKLIREISNQSQEVFAAACGISTEILSLIEREKSDPRLSTIQKIAAYIGCDVADLLTKGDEKKWNTYINSEQTLQSMTENHFRHTG